MIGVVVNGSAAVLDPGVEYGVHRFCRHDAMLAHLVRFSNSGGGQRETSNKQLPGWKGTSGPEMKCP